MTAGRLGGALLALVAVLVVAAAPVEARERHPHIVGGTPAAPTSFAAQVRITYPFGTVASCGGTLVAARYVVTAGHCVAPDASLGGTPRRVDVTIGATDLATDGTAERMTGVGVIANPAYSTSGFGGSGAPRNDVAVLRLPVPSTKVPARLPRTADAALWAPGVTAVAYGYGLTNGADDRSSSSLLQQVDLPIVADERCRQTFGTEFEPTTDLCAGGVSGKDTCQGDSGGPLVVADRAGLPTLAGVTSFGDECGRTFGVYTEAGGGVSGFLRSVIPQVELDAPATANVGSTVTLTATGTDPDGSGPFGGYDALAWDLDGNGDYADATGATVAYDPPLGRSVVSVLATDAAGNRETRTAVVTGTRLAARVGVRASRSRVRRGRFLVAVSPNQAGRIAVTARRGARLLARSSTLRVGAAGTRRLAVRLTTAGRRELRTRKRVRAVVRATFTPAAGGASRTARRTVTYR